MWCFMVCPMRCFMVCCLWCLMVCYLWCLVVCYLWCFMVCEWCTQWTEEFLHEGIGQVMARVSVGSQRVGDTVCQCQSVITQPH